MHAAETRAPASAAPRLDSVDLLRGLVMVLMALDHTRGFLSNAAFYPLDLEKTNVTLFLTRWITHYCAPVFIFLAGTGAFLSTTRGKTTRDLSLFLLTRGLWLVFLEITWVRCLGWNFHFDFHSVGVNVIWAIGWSMVALSALVWLPVQVTALFGVVMMLGHNALDGIKPDAFGSWAWLWKVLHAGGTFEIAPGWKVGAGYPLIPWIGVMAAGFGLGKLLLADAGRRRTWLLVLGAGMTLLFVVLRFTNLYGDPTPWKPQKDGLFSALSFLHCQKYPPSLCFLLMTLGPALVLLAWFDRGVPRWLQPAVVFGRVPLFYYMLHLPLIHALAIGANLLRHGHAHWLYGVQPVAAPPPPPLEWTDRGFGLAGVYLLWLLAVLLLYPACKWFAELKRRSRAKWLSYL